ncbi:hypothetical protein [Kribbella sp. DT2]|uniref:hypothetical protein n=1 Tax=Kribbella sp. DT2 TaxID=3393427 RepID=UPI003CF606F1
MNVGQAAELFFEMPHADAFPPDQAVTLIKAWSRLPHSPAELAAELGLIAATFSADQEDPTHDR